MAGGGPSMVADVAAIGVLLINFWRLRDPGVGVLS